MLRLLMLTVTGVLLAAQAYAAEVAFTDQTIHWPGYLESEDAYAGVENPDGTPFVSSHNDQDHYGTPNITGGLVTTANNRLASIRVNFIITSEPAWPEGMSRDIWNILYPGDLFLDVGSDGVWDYVVVMNPDKTDWTPIDVYIEPAQFGLRRAAGLYPLHRFNAPLQAPFQGGYPYHETIKPQNFRPRYDHPIWADLGSGYAGQQVGMVQFSGMPAYPANYNLEEVSATYNFATESLQGLNINAENLTIGFTVSSASDVILTRVRATDDIETRAMPVSIPNMLLLNQ